jgi:hypothetical protein
MSGLIPVAGLLASFAGVWLLARDWSGRRTQHRGRLRTHAPSLALLAAAVGIWIAAYGALRGSVIALCVLGGVAIPVALILELRGSAAGASKPRG